MIIGQNDLRAVLAAEEGRLECKQGWDGIDCGYWCRHCSKEGSPLGAMLGRAILREEDVYLQ